MTKKELLPVTVLTGFLGAGKTTLLNHLLTAKHGYKCAVIINEFGSVSIDNQIVVGADEEIMELNNGCLCCRVRGDLIKSIEELLNKRKRFDYLVIETTGLADPSPIAHTFMATDLAERVRLDGIITVVDARHIEKELDDAPEPAAQIAFADVILLNKTDLVSPADLARIEHRIRHMNALTRIHRTQNSQIDVGQILNIRARNLDTALELPADKYSHDHAHDHDHKHGEDCDVSGHDHEHDHDHEHEHFHDEKVKSFVITEDRALDLKKTEKWLGEILAKLGENIYRSKGILYIKGMPRRVVFQGVQMMFDAAPDRLWNAGEAKKNQLVFIGRELPEDEVRKGFETCIAE